MKTITTTDELARFCGAAKDQPYVTIDTEFLRERTYYSKLCLIQMALPGKDGEAVLVDPLAEIEVVFEFGDVARAHRAVGFGGVSDVEDDAEFRPIAF